MMSMNQQNGNQQQQQQYEEAYKESEEEQSDYDEETKEELDGRNDFNKELIVAMQKAKLVLAKALFSYAYYRLSKYLLNFFAKKLFNSPEFFFWNIFGFSKIVSKTAN